MKSAAAASPAPANVSVETDGDYMIVRTPYLPAFIDALKAAVTWKDRTWNAPAHPKAWMVKKAHAAAVNKLLADHFGAKV